MGVSFLAETARVIVRSAVRELVKGKFNVSDEFFKRLDSDVAALVRRAAERANANKRKTLKARDI
jgi:histone H3/H4